MSEVESKEADKIEAKPEDAKDSAAGDKDATKEVISKEQEKINQENRKIGSFPGDLSNIKPIFSLKSKNQ